MQEFVVRAVEIQEGLEPGEDWLCIDLIRSDEMDDDADVGQVDEPIWLIEAETGEDVSRSVVAECYIAYATEQEVEDGGQADTVARRLLHRLVLSRRRLQGVLHDSEHMEHQPSSSHRLISLLIRSILSMQIKCVMSIRGSTYLNLNQDVCKSVCKGNVPQCQEHVEGLLACGDTAGATQSASEFAMRNPLPDAQAEADEGVTERRRDRHHRQPCYVLQARELGQHELEEAEHHHVHVP